MCNLVFRVALEAHVCMAPLYVEGEKEIWMSIASRLYHVKCIQVTRSTSPPFGHVVRKVIEELAASFKRAWIFVLSINAEVA